ncbi:autotransporter outer membrane beta-barrel domain-containing protein, partial [Escherichia coli]
SHFSAYLTLWFPLLIWWTPLCLIRQILTRRFRLYAYEFSDGNKVRLGDESVNASIDGAAFRVGAGVQADITKNMGAYASLDYTKGDDIENPLQGVVGINVTW